MRKRDKKPINIEPEIMTNEMIFEFGTKTEKKEFSHRKKLEKKQMKKDKKQKKILKKEKKHEKKLEKQARKDEKKEKKLETQTLRNEKKEEKTKIQINKAVKNISEQEKDLKTDKKQEITVKSTIKKETEKVPTKDIEKAVVTKKNLEEYFKKTKKQNKRLLIKETKRTNKVKQEKTNKPRTGSSYLFGDITYYTVEELIKFLDENYLNLDKIAKEILDDADFHKWLNEKSESFEESIRHFKELKEIIEKK